MFLHMFLACNAILHFYTTVRFARLGEERRGEGGEERRQ